MVDCVVMVGFEYGGGELLGASWDLLMLGRDFEAEADQSAGPFVIGSWTRLPTTDDVSFLSIYGFRYVR